jgi:hypothetical protein
MLILGIVMAALALFVLFGSQAIQSTKDGAQTTQAGQAFTVADSRLSKARFSTSIFQETPFRLTGGSLVANSTDGNITIYDVDLITGTKTMIYNQTLGTIKCVTKDGTVGYQDGGVWMKYTGSGSTMLSPPDFDFNGVTLTLPIMRIAGNSATAYSDSTAMIYANSTGIPTVIFPGTIGYNPLPQNHSIDIYITSDFADAWKTYLNERTRANATLISPNTVYVRLNTGVGRQAGSPDSGFHTKAMNTDNPVPVELFNFTFYFKNSGEDYWLNYDTGDVNGKSLHIFIGRVTGPLNKDFSKVVYTYTDGTNTESFTGYLPHHRKTDTEWSVNLLDRNMTPSIIDSKTCYVMVYDGDNPSTSWGTDPDDYDPNPLTYYDYGGDLNPGEYTSVYDVTEHYLLLMAEACNSAGPYYDVGKGAHNGAHGYEPPSNFILEYDSKQDIKYLYITEGTLDINMGAKS